MRCIPVSFLAAAAIALATPALAAPSTYGRAMPEGAAQPIEAVMAAPEAHAGKTLKVQGRIGPVCQKTGCWLMLDNGGQGIRVRTQHAFFVPKDASGTAIVHGTLQPVALSGAQAAHYADDGAAPDGRREWQVLATAIVISP